MKKLLSLILVFTILFGVICSVPELDTSIIVKASANSAEVLSFTFNENEQAYWVTDCDNAVKGAVTIPDTYNGAAVTGIGASAFLNCSDMTSVTIPEGVTVIGSGAFENCSDLVSVYIPSTLTSVGSWAFYKCTGLKRVCITDLAAWFGIDFNSGFFPNPLFYARNLFLNGEKIEELVVPEAVTVIKDRAFTNCSITSVVIHSGVEKIGYSAFEDSDVENVFYQGTTEQWAEVDIYSSNDSLTKANIHYEATAHIPSGKWLTNGSVCFSGEAGIAFQMCKYCDAVCVEKEVSGGHDFIDGVCELCGTAEFSYHLNEDNEAVISGYYGDKTILTIPEELDGHKVVEIQDLGSLNEDGKYSYSKVEELTIPDTVKAIGDWAFYKCKNLRRVESGSDLKSIGAYAFSECTALEVVILPEQLDEVGEYAFSGCTSLKSINLPLSLTKISDGLFADCESLESVRMFPVTEIGYGAFYNCKKLKSIDLTGVKEIGSSAFAGCESLEAIEIPAEVSTVTADMFYGCKSLNEISVSLLNTTFKVVDGVLLGDSKTRLILYPAGLTSDTYTIPETVTQIDMGAFAGCTQLKTIVVRETMTSIPYGAFVECTGLETVVLPDTLTEISSEAFVMCSNLKNINIPDSVTAIGSYAFGSCDSLQTIDIPKNVASIGDYAFFDCTGLKSINVSSENTEYVSVNGVLFNKDKTILIAYPAAKQDKEYVVPETVTQIASDAFYNAKNLEKVTMGENIELIGWSAFSGCEKLTSIEIPDKVVDIEGFAFFGSAYYNNSENWENGALYVGNHLVDVNEASEELVIKDGAINIANYITSDVVKSIALPESLLSVGDSGFDSFYALEKISVDENNAEYSSEDGVLYNKDKTELIKIPLNKVADRLGVPETVKRIHKNNLALEINKLYIPLSVTKIDAQDSCDVIICYEGTQAQWNEIEFEAELSPDDIYFEAFDIGELYILPQNVGPFIQYRVRNDKTVVLETLDMNGDYDIPTYYEMPAEVNGYPIKAIGDNLFEMNGLLYSIIIPEGVEEIGYRAFYYCYNLYEITLPDSIKEIGYEAFDKTVYYDDSTNWDGDELYINSYLIKADNSEEGSDYTVKDGTKGIASGAFAGANIKTLTVSEGVASISGDIFNDSQVESLMLPQTLAYIGDYGFVNYTVDYIFYNGTEADWALVETAGSNPAFNGKPVHIGTTEHIFKWFDVQQPTTTVEGLRQYKCIVCDYVQGEEKIPVLDGFNFILNADGTYQLSSYEGVKGNVKIPDTHNDSSVTMVGNSCFKDNITVTSIVIPSTVTEIGYLAFMNCSNLKSVVIPESVTSIGTQAFYGFTGTIYCQKDSFAHSYAIENNISYIVPSVEGADSDTIIDFENQIIATSIKSADDILDIIGTSPTMTVLTTPSFKNEFGECLGTGSIVTIFDGDNYLGDYVLVVEGDLNGDAVCDVLDAVMVQRYSSDEDAPSIYEVYAANGYAADGIDVNSYQNVVNVLLDA